MGPSHSYRIANLSCWNGQSGAEASVTYPEGFNEQGDNDEEAECPSDHPKMLPRLFLEVWVSALLNILWMDDLR